jgi:succinate dehydrogenase / fumarate reductase, cytochrome b subunit
MSKTGVIKSSIMNKTWMALTGLFLCTFLIGHLLGNLQLIFKTGEEGRRAFNEYAYFMGHNVFIKILAYVTYFSILFHAFKGLWLWKKNKEARPKKYAYERPSTNSKLPSRYMAILGTIILVFICTHMAQFWWKQKIVETVPLHTVTKQISLPQQDPNTGQMFSTDIAQEYYLTTQGEFIPKDHPLSSQAGPDIIKNISNTEGEHLFNSQGLRIAEGYKDLHTVVMAAFSKSNNLGLIMVLLYVLSMAVMGFHLWHGFSSAFQSLGINHRKYNKIISLSGKVFSVGVSAAFAIIPALIYLRS